MQFLATLNQCLHTVSWHMAVFVVHVNYLAIVYHGFCFRHGFKPTVISYLWHSELKVPDVNSTSHMAKLGDMLA